MGSLILVSTAQLERVILQVVAYNRELDLKLYISVSLLVGKSTLINALIGSNILKSGVLPTTNKVCIVRHESEQSSQGSLWRQADNMLLGDVQEMKVDLHWLKNIAIVDTPGTNAIVSDHEHLTEQIIPRADLILFVTSAERPMSDSGMLPATVTITSNLIKFKFESFFSD